MGRRMDGRKTAWFLLLVGDDYDSLCNKKRIRRGEVLKDVMDLLLLLLLLHVLVYLSCDRPTCNLWGDSERRKLLIASN